MSLLSLLVSLESLLKKKKKVFISFIKKVLLAPNFWMVVYILTFVGYKCWWSYVEECSRLNKRVDRYADTMEI